MNPAVPDQGGRWVLLDAHGALVLLDGEPFAHVSARRRLSNIERRLLLPALKLALEAEVEPPQAFTARSSELEYSIEVQQIRSPATQRLTAVLGCVRAVSLPRHPEPVIGCWEWTVAGSASSPEIQIAWDRNQFELYELSAHSRKISPPDWINELVLPESRLKLKTVIDAGIAQQTPEPHSIFYGIRTGPEDSPRSKQLRLAGRAYRHGGTLTLRGISHEAFDNMPDRTPGIKGQDAALLGAAYELIASPACVVDTHTWEMFMTNGAWLRGGLPPARDRSVFDLVEQADYLALQAFFRTLTSAMDAPQMSPALTFLLADGSRVVGRTSAIRPSATDGRYVACVFELNR